MNSIKLIATTKYDLVRLDFGDVFEGSQREDMLTLTDCHIADHELRLTAVDAEKDESLAVGYIACKTFMQQKRTRQNSDLLAIIGGLYVKPDYRGQGLGQSLVDAITDEVMAGRCVSDAAAVCNTRGQSLFANAGYEVRLDSGLSVTDGKTAMWLNRQAWATMRGEYGANQTSAKSRYKY